MPVGRSVAASCATGESVPAGNLRAPTIFILYAKHTTTTTGNTFRASSGAGDWCAGRGYKMEPNSAIQVLMDGEVGAGVPALGQALGCPAQPDPRHNQGNGRAGPDSLRLPTTPSSRTDDETGRPGTGVLSRSAKLRGTSALLRALRAPPRTANQISDKIGPTAGASKFAPAAPGLGDTRTHTHTPPGLGGGERGHVVGDVRPPWP